MTPITSNKVTKAKDLLKEVNPETGKFTLEELKEKFLEKEDPTEYFFAVDILGSWDTWKELRSFKLVRTEIEKWRDELEVKLRAKSFMALLEEARNKNSRNSYDANKMIVKEGWKLPEASMGRGRPSKEDIKRELAKQAALEKEILDNAKRAGVVVEIDQMKKVANG